LLRLVAAVSAAPQQHFGVGRLEEQALAISGPVREPARPDPTQTIEIEDRANHEPVNTNGQLCPVRRHPGPVRVGWHLSQICLTTGTVDHDKTPWRRRRLLPPGFHGLVSQ
jgi:hypothetical protein